MNTEKKPWSIKMTLWPHACQVCGGDVYPHYKKGRIMDNGRLSPGNPKCLHCSRYGPGILYPAWLTVWEQEIKT